MRIVILSYNNLELTKKCIESIRKNTLPSSREIVAIDNASNDGSAEWLESQDDIISNLSDVNLGFPGGCNLGIGIAKAENDIFLLNNDTVVYPNSVFWLRMGLYSDNEVGSAGCKSNYVSNYQKVDCNCNTEDEYEAVARNINLPENNPWEQRLYLVAFALIIKRRCLQNVGVFDERFFPGTYEDVDIGFRMAEMGWKNILCHNSFIFHSGHGDGKNKKTWDDIEKTNRNKLKEKIGFSPTYYNMCRYELIQRIDKKESDSFSILEVGWMRNGGYLASY